MYPEPESDQPEAVDADDELQFDTAEPTTAAVVPARTCIGCKRPITDTYYSLKGNVICPSCCAAVNAPPPGSRLGRIVRATAMGIGAALAGALIWYAIRRVTQLNLGIVAVVVGFMVGKAVRKGSGNRGGVGYQVLAVVLAYVGVAMNWFPDFLEAMQKHSDNQRLGLEIFEAIIAAMALPFFAGVKDLLLLLIIGFALWQAWKLNTPRSLAITGPYQIGTGPPLRAQA